MDESQVKSEVQKRYAAIARQGGCGCGSASAESSCCSGEGQVSSTLICYEQVGLAAEPGAELGLGCGFPTLAAGLRPGERVLDLGSGAGVDAFLAAKAVGPQGWVIGVDMTPEMLARAWENAARGGYSNVEFRLGEIQALPLPASDVDVVISNCVINLVPDKRRVFAEIYRVLKPGGRFAISDIVSIGDVPEAVRRDMELWTGCIAGAIDREEYLGIIREAGFTQARISQMTEYGDLREKGYGFASVTVEGAKVS